MNNSVKYGQTLKPLIEQAWQKQSDQLSLNQKEKEAIISCLDLLDQGKLRVSEKQENGNWIVYKWLKKAILLSFSIYPMQLVSGGIGKGHWWDKIASKFHNWTEDNFKSAGFRAVPGSIVRHSAFIAPQAVLMPCFVNIGAYVGRSTMVDTWATIGSCAQIGAHCHISGGAGIGGVLEPLQANPVIIEDHCFIGARSEIAEGVIVREGAVISMGVFISASTKIIDRTKGNQISYGEIPPYAVIIPGSMPSQAQEGPMLSCAVIVKYVDQKTRSKTSINEILRD